MRNSSTRDAETTHDEQHPVAQQYQPLVIVLVAVCAGIVADRYWPASVLVWWAIAGVGWSAWLALWRCGRERTAALVLLTAVAATAASWHHCRWFLFAEDDLGSFARSETQPVCIEAIALTSARAVPRPEADPMRAIPIKDRVRLEIEITSLRDGSRWRDVSGRTQLEVTGRSLDVRAGDRLRVFGQLSAPRKPRNPGEFDYADYLRADRTRSRIRAEFPECTSMVRAGSGNGPS